MYFVSFGWSDDHHVPTIRRLLNTSTPQRLYTSTPLRLNTRHQRTPYKNDCVAVIFYITVVPTADEYFIFQLKEPILKLSLRVIKINDVFTFSKIFSLIRCTCLLRFFIIAYFNYLFIFTWFLIIFDVNYIKIFI